MGGASLTNAINKKGNCQLCYSNIRLQLYTSQTSHMYLYPCLVSSPSLPLPLPLVSITMYFLQHPSFSLTSSLFYQLSHPFLSPLLFLLPHPTLQPNALEGKLDALMSRGMTSKWVCVIRRCVGLCVCVLLLACKLWLCVCDAVYRDVWRSYSALNYLSLCLRAMQDFQRHTNRSASKYTRTYTYNVSAWTSMELS